MARKLGSKDKKQRRKQQILRNIKATSIIGGFGAANGALLGGLNALKEGENIKTGIIGSAVVGGGGLIGLHEFGWRRNKELRQKAGYGNADRLEVLSKLDKYSKMTNDYRTKQKSRK